MLKLVLVTKITTSIKDGAPDIEYERSIYKLDTPLKTFVNLFPIANNPNTHFPLDTVNMDGGRTISVMSQSDKKSLCIHFTQFSSLDLPYYAKFLKPNELQNFIKYAEDVGIVFAGA